MKTEKSIPLFVLFPSARDVDAAHRAGRTDVFFFSGPCFQSKDLERDNRLRKRLLKHRCLKNHVKFQSYQDMLNMILKFGGPAIVWMCNIYQCFNFTVDRAISMLLEATLQVKQSVTVFWFGHLLNRKASRFGLTGYYYHEDNNVVTYPHLGATSGDKYCHERPFLGTKLKGLVHEHPLGHFINFGMPLSELNDLTRDTTYAGNLHKNMYHEMLKLRISQSSTQSSIFSALDSMRPKFNSLLLPPGDDYKLIDPEYMDMMDKIFVETRDAAATALMDRLNEEATRSDNVKRLVVSNHTHLFCNPISGALQLLSKHLNEVVVLIGAVYGIKPITVVR
jgi:hypothetical protein